MKGQDDYAALASVRDRAYLAAYASPEADAWRASLTPAQRLDAEAKGLLAPCLPTNGGGTSVDALPPAKQPLVEACVGEDDEAQERERFMDYCSSPEQVELLALFLQEGGNPKLRWACLRFLMGHGTCESHAQRLGMTRQAFSHQVRTLQERLGLPAMGNQKSASAREKYRSNWTPRRIKDAPG